MARSQRMKRLREQYRIRVEVGLVLSLLIVIGAFSLGWSSADPVFVPAEPRETIDATDVEPTPHHRETPPPPPRPLISVVKPDEQVLRDVEIEFEPIDLDTPVDLLESPPEYPGEDEPPEPEEFRIVEEMPEMLPSQEDGLRQLAACVEYPETAKRAGIEGMVVVELVVDERGQVVDPVVRSSPGAGTGDEALRCVRELRFEPGRQRGAAVRVRMSVPVTFRLQ